MLSWIEIIIFLIIITVIILFISKNHKYRDQMHLLHIFLQKQGMEQTC